MSEIIGFCWILQAFPNISKSIFIKTFMIIMHACKEIQKKKTSQTSILYFQKMTWISTT